jgi:hypothetical protein
MKTVPLKIENSSSKKLKTVPKNGNSSQKWKQFPKMETVPKNKNSSQKFK